jgi:hypothetical protein
MSAWVLLAVELALLALAWLVARLPRRGEPQTLPDATPLAQGLRARDRTARRSAARSLLHSAAR